MKVFHMPSLGLVWQRGGGWTPHEESQCLKTHTPLGILKLSMSQYWAHENLVHAALLGPQSTQTICNSTVLMQNLTGRNGWTAKQNLTTRDNSVYTLWQITGLMVEGECSGKPSHSLHHCELKQSIHFPCFGFEGCRVWHVKLPSSPPICIIKLLCFTLQSSPSLRLRKEQHNV